MFRIGCLITGSTETAAVNTLLRVTAMTVSNRRSHSLYSRGLDYCQAPKVARLVSAWYIVRCVIGSGAGLQCDTTASTFIAFGPIQYTLC